MTRSQEAEKLMEKILVLFFDKQFVAFSFEKLTGIFLL